MAKKIRYRTPKEVMELWIKSLRSGKYKQTQACLKNDEGFCCLGVLCDLASKDGGNEWYAPNQDGQFAFVGFGNISDTEMPPEELTAYVGMSYDDAHAVANMNDDGYTFSEIADHLEKEYLPKIS